MDRSKQGRVGAHDANSQPPEANPQGAATRALDSIIEMARWRNPGHAYAARMILGRIAGIDETSLVRLVAGGQVDQIINRLDLRW